MKRKLKVYLAGTVTETDYRNICKKRFSNILDLKDPLELVPETLPDHKVIEGDLSLIYSSDILVAYINKPTFGTIMEIVYAKRAGKTIYVINPDGRYFKDKWLSQHTDKFFRTISDCFEHIINENNLRKSNLEDYDERDVSEVETFVRSFQDMEW